MGKRNRRQRKRCRTARRAADTALHYRAFPVRGSSIDQERRTAETVITTEAPVPMFDWERWEIIPEVLLTSGMKRTGQVPLLDAHSRHSIGNQLGSVRGIRKENSETVGQLHFSSTAEAEWTKVREGHVDSVSAGYQNLKVRHVPEGETQEIEGREFSGPVNVVTSWRLREVSLVPIGADEQAKLRGYDPAALHTKDSQPKDSPMNKKLRNACVKAGMDAQLSDDDAMRWFQDHQGDALRTLTEELDPETSPPPAAPTVTLDENGLRALLGLARAGTDGDSTPPASGLTLDQLNTVLDERDGRRREERQRLSSEIDTMLELAFGEGEQAVPGGLRAACLEAGTVEAARDLIKKRRAELAAEFDVPMARVGLAGSQPVERHRAAVESAFLVRALENASQAVESDSLSERHLPAAERAQGWEDFSRVSFLELGRQCLLIDGFRYELLARLSNVELAMAACGFPNKVRSLVPHLRSAGYPAYHTTGTLALITQDAVNKTLLAGYSEYPATWRGPFRQAQSAQDFKTIHRIKLSAAPDLPLWPDNVPPERVRLSNEEEKYAVEARAEEIDFSWRMMVNDDLDAISRVPVMMGDAAARTVNRFAWSLVTSNPKMSDGETLFRAAQANGPRFRKNLLTGAGGIATASIALGKVAMRQQRGLNGKNDKGEWVEGDDILNLEPTYIVVPSTLEQDALVAVRSAADPEKDRSSAVYNTARTLTPIVEPILDADNESAWYLFASTNRIDTGEVTFLAGQEQPVAMDHVDEKTMSRCFTILQTFGGSMIDHRGVVRIENSASRT